MEAVVGRGGVSGIARLELVEHGDERFAELTDRGVESGFAFMHVGPHVGRREGVARSVGRFESNGGHHVDGGVDDAQAIVVEHVLRLPCALVAFGDGGELVKQQGDVFHEVVGRAPVDDQVAVPKQFQIRLASLLSCGNDGGHLFVGEALGFVVASEGEVAAVELVVELGAQGSRRGAHLRHEAPSVFEGQAGAVVEAEIGEHVADVHVSLDGDGVDGCRVGREERNGRVVERPNAVGVHRIDGDHRPHQGQPDKGFVHGVGFELVLRGEHDELLLGFCPTVGLAEVAGVVQACHG